MTASGTPMRSPGPPQTASSTASAATKFAPSEPVTREQLAAIFFRYAKAEAPEADVLSGYPDAESVSTYARDAMAWAVSTGLVTGSKEADGTYLVPQGLAAREQAAAILMRYAKVNA